MMRNSVTVTVGDVKIGGGERVKIQSMTTTKTSDLERTLSQISALKTAGCEIVRVAVLDETDALAIKTLVEKCGLPVVADIHFSHRLAALAIENGAHKIRINPGNIGGEREISYVADCLKTHKIPVRVGSNTGSIEKSFLEKYGKNEVSLVESALANARVLEKCGVDQIVLSVKASSAPLTVKAYTLLAEKTDYPLHLGVTEAGNQEMGMVKSATGIGSLLCDGIGDTFRVSLTADPVQEVYAAKKILTALGVEGQSGMQIVSCPTCGRTKIDLISLSAQFEAAARTEGLMDFPIKVALMGCVVNGPGEAREADIGIAGGKGEALLIAKGEILQKIPESQIIPVLIEKIKAMKGQ